MIGSLAVAYVTKLANDHLSQSRIKEANDTIYYITNFLEFFRMQTWKFHQERQSIYVYNQMAYQVQ